MKGIQLIGAVLLGISGVLHAEQAQPAPVPPQSAAGQSQPGSYGGGHSGMPGQPTPDSVQRQQQAAAQINQAVKGAERAIRGMKRDLAKLEKQRTELMQGVQEQLKPEKLYSGITELSSVRSAIQLAHESLGGEPIKVSELGPKDTIKALSERERNVNRALTVLGRWDTKSNTETENSKYEFPMPLLKNLLDGEFRAPAEPEPGQIIQGGTVASSVKAIFDALLTEPKVRDFKNNVATAGHAQKKP